MSSQINAQQTKAKELKKNGDAHQKVLQTKKRKRAESSMQLHLEFRSLYFDLKSKLI